MKQSTEQAIEESEPIDRAREWPLLPYVLVTVEKPLGMVVGAPKC
jgi:hypothetical protein